MHDYAKIRAAKEKDRAAFASLSSMKRKRRGNKGRSKGPKGGTRPPKHKRRGKSRDFVVVDAKGYPKAWTWMLRNHVRSLWGRRCAWCGTHEKEVGKVLHVHHKDKNKINCAVSNLVPLCPECHTLLAHGGYWSEL